MVASPLFDSASSREFQAGVFLLSQMLSRLKKLHERRNRKHEKLLLAN